LLLFRFRLRMRGELKNMQRRRPAAPRRVPKAPRLRVSPLKRTDVTRAEYNRIIEILNERNEILNGLLLTHLNGEMSEWLKEHAWKANRATHTE
jgi:hypothetical protein